MGVPIFIERGKFSINDIANLKNKLIIFTMLFVGLMMILSYGVGNVSAASGNNIYVNTHGNDSWNGQNPVWNGTSGPKLSIKNATGTVNKGGTIKIANGVYTGTKNTHITIDRNMNIIGQSREGTVINGYGKNWIFQIKPGITVYISNLSLINGKTSKSGGAISNKGILTVKNCKFNNNNAYAGGAIDNYIGCKLNVASSSFSKNHAYFGGAIENAGKMNVNKSFFTDNSATFGGAIDNADNLIVTDSSLISNNAMTAGGAISNYEGYINLHFNKIVGNKAGSGSAIIYGVGSADLTKNWWGSNSGPLNSVVGTSNVYPWLILNTTIKNTSTTRNNTVSTNAYQSKQAANISYKSNCMNSTYSNGVVFKTIRLIFSQPIKAGTMWIEIKNSRGIIKILGLNIHGNVLIIKVSALLSGRYTIILHNASIINLKGTPIPYSVCNFKINTEPNLKFEQISQKNVIVQSKSSNLFYIKNIILKTVGSINNQLMRI